MKFSSDIEDKIVKAVEATGIPRESIEKFLIAKGLATPEAPASGVAEAIFPRAYKKAGESYLDEISAAALDIASLPGRAIAASAGGDEPYLTDLAHIKSPTGNLVGDIVRAPATAAGLAALPVTSTLGGAVAGFAGKLTGMGAQAVAEGFITGLTRAKDDELKTGKFSVAPAVEDAAINLTLGPVLTTAQPHVIKALRKLASSLTNVDEKALEILGKTGGKDMLREWADSAQRVGNELLDTVSLSNKKGIVEIPVINDALKKMPPIKMDGIAEIYDKYISHKTGVEAREEMNEMLRRRKDFFVERFAKNADGDGILNAPRLREVPAAEVKKEIETLYKEAYGSYNASGVKTINDIKKQAIKDVAANMRLKLRDAAVESGNPEFVDAMEALAKKYDVLEKLEMFLGKTDDTKASKVESFVSTLTGRNKKRKRELIGIVDEIYGTDFLNHAENIRIAGTLGQKFLETGEIPILPTYTTGKSLAGFQLAGGILGAKALPPALSILAAPAGIGLMALSSPTLAPKTLKYLDVLTQQASSPAKTFAARRTLSELSKD